MGWVSRKIPYTHISGSCAISPDGSTIAYGYSGGKSTDGVQVIKNYGTPVEISFFISIPGSEAPQFYGYGISLDSTGSYLGTTGIAGNFATWGAAGTGHLYNMIYSPNLKSSGNTIVTDSNIFAPFFIGNGSLLTGLSGTAVSGTVASAQIVTQASQPAITSLGVLTGLAVAGQVAGNQFIGDGSALSGIQSANISQPFANLVVSNSLSTTNVFAATTVLSGAAGKTSLNVTGNIYASNALSTTNIFASGQIKAVGNVALSISGICAPVIKRQGGSAADWSTGWTQGGGSDYPVSSGAVNIQVGARVGVGTQTSVAFPQPYVNKPIVLITKTEGTQYIPSVSSVSRTGFNIIQSSGDGTTVNWMAIGI